jgi:hypothetical protein
VAHEKLDVSLTGVQAAGGDQVTKEGGGGRRLVMGVCSGVREEARRTVWSEVRRGRGTIL